MANELAVSNQLSDDQIKLIKSQICKGSSDDELKLFIQVCNKTGLDPFTRQIYAIKRWDSKEGRDVMQTQVSIDGMRLIAERSNQYAGQLGPFWCGKDAKWVEIWTASQPPFAAKVGVLRHDFKEVMWAVARFDAYAQRRKDGSPTAMWAKMPDLMIAKCAEALALRKAFPMELSGLYATEEMQQADDHHETQEAKPSRVTPPPVHEVVAEVAGVIGSGEVEMPMNEVKAEKKEESRKHKLIRQLYFVCCNEGQLGMKKEEIAPYIKRVLCRDDIKGMDDVTEDDLVKVIEIAKDEAKNKFAA